MESKLMTSLQTTHIELLTFTADFLNYEIY